MNNLEKITQWKSMVNQAYNNLFNFDTSLLVFLSTKINNYDNSKTKQKNIDCFISSVSDITSRLIEIENELTDYILQGDYVDYTKINDKNNFLFIKYKRFLYNRIEKLQLIINELSSININNLLKQFINTKSNDKINIFHYFDDIKVQFANTVKLLSTLIDLIKDEFNNLPS
jgi:hypothetical protein